MRIEKVVVGVDFSETANDAARWVAHQFAPDAEIVLAHVVDLPRTPDYLRDSDLPLDELEIAARTAAAERLQEVATIVGLPNARTEIRVGRAHEELANLTAEIGADLVCVGPHGDRPRPWKLLGTTAERLVRAANPAVLIAAHPAPAPPVTMLLAVDETPVTRVMLEWTREIADALEAEVTAVHVVSNAAMSHVMSMAAVRSHDESERVSRVSFDMLREGSRWLETIAAMGLGRRCAECIVMHGKAGDMILETAREIGADLIVLGRRGTSAIGPVVLGSTVSTVLHGAPCPVLVVTEAETEWDETGVA